MNKSELRSTVLERLAKLLGPCEFRLHKKDHLLVRKLEGGEQRLSMAIVDHRPVFNYAIIPSVSFTKVSLLYAKFSHVKPGLESKIASAIFRLLFVTEQGKDWIEIKNDHELQLSLEIVDGIVLNKIVPLLNRCTTIEALDEIINAELKPKLENTNLFSRALSGVIVAGLASNPRLEVIVERYLAEMEQFPEDKKIAVQECKRYVQSLSEQEKLL